MCFDNPNNEQRDTSYIGFVYRQNREQTMRSSMDEAMQDHYGTAPTRGRREGSEVQRRSIMATKTQVIGKSRDNQKACCESDCRLF